MRAEQDAVNDRIERLIRENAQVAQDQQEYKLRIEALYARCEELKSSMAKVRSQIMDRAGRSRNVEAYLQRIGRTEPLTVFDESVFTGTVDCVTVCKGQGKNDRQMVFYCFEMRVHKYTFISHDFINSINVSSSNLQ